MEEINNFQQEKSRGRSTKTSDGLAAIQAQLNNLGREIKKVNEKVYAAQVGLGNHGPKFTKAYEASHINNTIPRKEKDQGSFTLPYFINDVCFDNALVNLGASISVMPRLTYLNLGLGELAHTRLTVELADSTVKYPKGIAENVLVGIGPVTADEKTQKKNDVKERSIFGGNDATKKTQKTLLKQMYENCSAPSTESLDSIFYRLQKIRNKPDLDTMSFDDLYNNFKIVEQEEFQQPEFEGYGPKTSKSVNEDTSNEVRESLDALLVEELVPNDKLEKKTVFPIANYNYHQRERVISENNYTKVNYNYSAKKTYPSAHRNIVPRAVLMKTGLRLLNTVKPVNTAHPKTTVYSAISIQKVNTAKGKFSTARPNSVVVNAVRAHQGHPQNVQEDQGYVDSGCSRHMTGNMSYLSDFKEFNGGYVTFGRGENGGKITGKGTLKTDKLDFEDVYFVKELKFNLFSVSQMCDRNNNVLFTDTECLVLSPNFKLPNESQILLRVPRKNNMYNVDMKNIVPKESLTCLVAKATLDESMLWHRRLGHINFRNINKLVKENLVRGLPLKHFENDQTCIACLKGKQHKASCKSKIQNSISQPLFMLYMDLFGPTFVSSLMHKKYRLVVTDDYSRYTWDFFLPTKDETTGILKKFITEIENLVNKKVKIIICDNRTEFKNSVMNDFCAMKGIRREFSVSRTPQQNGVAKRRNRTLIEAART
ncbi:putative ribonuclease H-like domain-containing protein, partial [Tanacetum coccineum]